MRFQFPFDRCDPLSGLLLITDIIDERSGNDRFGTRFRDADLSIGMFVSNLEENPLTGVPAAADEHPLPMKLFSMEHKMEFTFFPALLRGRGIDHIVGAGIPYDDLTGAVVPFRDNSFEPAIIDRMVFGQHSETLLRWIEARPFGYGP